MRPRVSVLEPVPGIESRACGDICTQCLMKKKTFAFSITIPLYGRKSPGGPRVTWGEGCRVNSGEHGERTMKAICSEPK